MGRVLTIIMLLFTAALAFLLHLVSAHDRSDVIAYFSAELPQGNKCGPQRPITGWTEVTTATGRSWNGGTRTNGGFNTGTGIYTTPERGVYQCCASFRCRQGGVCDFSLLRNDNRFGCNKNFFYINNESSNFFPESFWNPRNRTFWTRMGESRAVCHQSL